MKTPFLILILIILHISSCTDEHNQNKKAKEKILNINVFSIEQINFNFRNGNEKPIVITDLTKILKFISVVENGYKTKFLKLRRKFDAELILINPSDTIRFSGTGISLSFDYNDQHFGIETKENVIDILTK